MDGLKTRIFGGLLILLGSLQQADFIALIPADKQGVFVAVVGFVVMLLREFTKTPGVLAKK